MCNLVRFSLSPVSHLFFFLKEEKKVKSGYEMKHFLKVFKTN